MYQHFSKIVILILILCFLAMDCNLVYGQVSRRRITGQRRIAVSKLTGSEVKLVKLPTAESEQTQSDTPDTEEEWNYIINNLKRYRIENFFNVHASFFSLQLYAVAKLAFENRREKGGWAGDFVRYVLIYEIQDIAEREEYWSSASSEEERKERLKDLFPTLFSWAVEAKKAARLNTEKKFKEKPADLKQALGMVVDSLMSVDVADFVEEQVEGQVKGLRHFEEHLEPAFYNYIHYKLLGVISKYPNRNSKKMQDAFQRELISEMKEIRNEHNAFIENSVIPTVNFLFLQSERNWEEKILKPKILEYNYWASKSALDIIPSEARKLRINTFKIVLKDLYKKNLVQVDEINEILSVLEITKSDDGLGK